MFRSYCFLILLLPVFFTACTKEQLLTSSAARLDTSSDSLYFDTLFSQALSITQSFRIYNQNDQKIKISSIHLAGGSSSVFRINVNGEAGPQVNDLEIAANDSIHIFVNTQVPATNSNQPFIVEDSILIQWNNNSRLVKLSAWGQTAHYIKNGQLTSNTVWDNELPYVLLGEFHVDQNATLQIKKGTRIYCHADATVIIDGSLNINGDTAYKDRVIFTGDRLDAPYKDYPASWPGIFFSNKSKDNSLAYTIIKNAYQGIILEGLPPANHHKLFLHQCIIDNIWDAGLLAINSAAELNNCLISNCGKNVQLVYGGNYRFVHCTIASYGTLYSSHKDPVLLLTDGITINAVLQTAPLEASFVNSIFWGNSGSVENEVVCLRQGSIPFSVVFNDGLWRVKDAPANTSSMNMLNDTDPAFENITGAVSSYNFRLQPASPALERGQYTNLPLDLDGKPRNIGIPDLGAFEKQ